MNIRRGASLRPLSQQKSVPNLNSELDLVVGTQSMSKLPLCSYNQLKLKPKKKDEWQLPPRADRGDQKKEKAKKAEKPPLSLPTT
jgi:hypothetical protein